MGFARVAPAPITFNGTTPPVRRGHAPPHPRGRVVIEYNATDNPDIVEVPIPIDLHCDQHGHTWSAPCPFCNIEVEWVGHEENNGYHTAPTWNISNAISPCSHYHNHDYDFEYARFTGLLTELLESWRGNVKEREDVR